MVAALQLARVQAAVRVGDFGTAQRAMAAYGRASAPQGRSLTIVDSEGNPQSRITVYERRVNARTAEEAARVGGSEPGQYVVRTGVLERLPERRQNPYSPSPTPLLTASIENAAGIRPSVATAFGQEQRMTQVDRARWALGQDRTVTTTTYDTRTGAQSQLAMLAAGKSQGEAFLAGYGPASFTVQESKTAPTAEWQRARETKGWRVLTDNPIRAGAKIEGIGLGMQDYAVGSYSTEPGVKGGARRFYSGAVYGGGKAYEFTGQWLGGLGKGVRDEPGRVVVAAGVGVAFGGAGKYLGTAARFGGVGAKAANFAFRAAPAVGLGVYAASEGVAIVRAERPGERAARTSLDVAAFSVGSTIGGSLVSSPKVSRVQVTSSKGVLTESGGAVQGTMTRRGTLYTQWLGRTQRTRFTASETFSGGRVEGTVRVAGQRPVRYGGTLVRSAQGEGGPTATAGLSSRQLFMRSGGGVESSTMARQGSQEFIIYGRSTGEGAGSYFGTTRGGRGSVSYFSRPPAPTRGLFTFAAGEAAEGFTPGYFSGFFAGTGGAGVAPAVAPSVAGYAGAPLFGAYAQGFGPVTGARGFFGLGGVSQPGQRSLLGVNSRTTFLSPVRSSVSVFSVVSPVAGDGAMVTPEVVGGNQVTTVTETGFSSRVEPLPSAGGGSSAWSPPPPVPPIPFFPEAGMPGFGFGLGRKGFGASGKTSFRTKYNPSIVAGEFNIRGSMRQGRAAALTGVAVRPIV